MPDRRPRDEDPPRGEDSSHDEDRVRGGRLRRGASIARLSASSGAGYLGARVRELAGDTDAEQRFHTENAMRLAEVLGSMKGAAMKLGQIASFIDLDVPPEVESIYHQVLAQLRAAAPPVDPEAIAQVVTEQFGGPPERVFARWDREPLASASIGQVHRAALADGTEVVVKVQYPGVAEAVEADLANAETFAPLARVAMPNLRVKPLLEELRARVVDELDYQREAAYQQAFAERYAGHPFVRVPRVHEEWCRPRVLTSDYVAGEDFDTFLARAGDDERQRAAEVVFRFTFGSLWRYRLFHGDPHPGNYLFPGDGSVVFIDYGSVKPFTSAARDGLGDQIRAILDSDVRALVAALREAGFVDAERDVDGDKLMAWFRLFNRPIVEDAPFTYTSEFAREVNRATSDPRAGWFDLFRRLNLPPDYLLLNRIQWGVNSILGRMGATANWHRICRELMGDHPPASPLGEAEAGFMAASPFRA